MDDRPIDKDGFVLAVDLDGVCADYYGGLQPIAAEWLGVDVDALPLEVGFGLEEWGIDQSEYQKMHHFAVKERRFFERLPAIAGAGPALRRLSRAGIQIRIVTARLAVPHVHEETIIQTMRWIEKTGIPFDDICFVTSKESVSADLYVEDSPHNIEALRARGIETLVFANSTNRDLRTKRIANWVELERLVLERARGRDQGGVDRDEQGTGR